jgi:hypothetical protein
MLKTRLQIEDGDIKDMAETYGFIYISSDHRLAAPKKSLETTTYAEQEGENTDPRTVDDAFDYKVKFAVLAPNNDLENANVKIRDFNALLYSKEKDSDVKTLKRVTFYNDYKRVKIAGLPNPISEATDFWRDDKGVVYDAVQVEWTIRVDKPSECDFATIKS